jgi:Ni,Fe-hydrogenase I cytochrome b subunit
MKSVAYVFMTVITMVFIGFGWEGGPNGHGYAHLVALLIGGFLAGCIYKTMREDIREEDGEKADGPNYI